jgi:nitrate reductase gamma subunit
MEPSLNKVINKLELSNKMMLIRIKRLALTHNVTIMLSRFWVNTKSNRLNKLVLSVLHKQLISGNYNRIEEEHFKVIQFKTQFPWQFKSLIVLVHSGTDQYKPLYVITNE